MKIIMVVAIATLFAAQAPTQALAQGKSPPATDEKAARAAAESQRRMKENEEAAKAAMSKIPDSKEKYDPWKIAR